MSNNYSEQEEITSWIKYAMGWPLIAIVVLSLVGWGLSSAGLFGSTIVERKVFENSFQYSEAQKTAIATYEAQLMEIDALLANPDAPESSKVGLRSQASVIRVRLRVAQGKLNKVVNPSLSLLP